MPLHKAKKLFVSETGIIFCAIYSQISFLALAIASKKIIQNRQWNLRKVVAIWRSQWNSGFSKEIEIFNPHFRPIVKILLQLHFDHKVEKVKIIMNKLVVILIWKITFKYLLHNHKEKVKITMNKPFVNMILGNLEVNFGTNYAVIWTIW